MIFLAEGDPARVVDVIGDVQDIARAVIFLVEGDPAAALDVLGDVQHMTPPVGSAFPAFGLVEARVLVGIAHLRLGDRNAAAAAVEAALAAAERDRLIFPFAMFDAVERVDAVPRQETAHGALLTDIVDMLQGESPASTDREHLWQAEELSPSELRVLRYLPTNLTRHEIASELYVSVNTVNTHIRNVYSKLGARSLFRRSTRTRAAAALIRARANIAELA